MGIFFSSPKKRQTEKRQIKALADLPSTDLEAFLNQHSVIRIALH